MQIFSVIKCNGNLLTHEYVISHASCKWDVSKKVRINSEMYDPEIIPVRAVYQHPKYNKADDSNDLVLIHLQYQTSLNPDPTVPDTAANNVSICSNVYIGICEYSNSTHNTNSPPIFPPASHLHSS